MNVRLLIGLFCLIFCTARADDLSAPLCLDDSCVPPARADVLPNSLTLKCEGEVGTLGGRTPEFSKFDTILKLQNGALSDIYTPSLTTKGCELRGVGIGRGITCSEQLVVPSTIGAGSEQRELKAYIARETGEYTHYLEIRSFKGRNPKGKEIGSLERFVRRTGVCHSISKPIF